MFFNITTSNKKKFIFKNQNKFLRYVAGHLEFFAVFQYSYFFIPQLLSGTLVRKHCQTHFRFSHRWCWRIKSSGMWRQNKNVWSWRRRHYDPSKYRWLSTSRHGAPSQMTWIFTLPILPSRSFHNHHSVITRRCRTCLKSVCTCTKSQSFARHRR
jgi:hypothetical protein